MTTIEEITQWERNEWEFPNPLPRIEKRPKVWVCPQVGLRIRRPRARETEFDVVKEAWYSKTELKSWWMPSFARDAWFKEIVDDLDNHWWRLGTDCTPRYYAGINDLKSLGGALIVVGGYPGSGKSTLAQMILTRIVTTTPYVIWKGSDLESITEGRTDQQMGVIIDEGDRDSGDNSLSAIKHDVNVWQASRKGELWGLHVGTNKRPAVFGEAVSLYLKCAGINKKYQATRFAMYREGYFIGLAVLQRKHLPSDQVYYYNELDTWATYEDRARAYSLEVTQQGGATGAVNDEQQTKHIERFKLHLIDFEQTNKYIPNDLMCKRLYRQVRPRLPTKNSSYIMEVIKWAKEELDKEAGAVVREERMQSLKGWDALRSDLTALIRQYGGSPRQAELAVPWLVPDWPLRSQSQVASDFDIGRDSIQKALSRGLVDIPPVEFGNIGERFIASHIDSPTTTARGTKGLPDILISHPDGDIAVNVKLVLREDRFRRTVETTPEDKWTPRAAAALVMARSLEIRLFPITTPESHLNSNEGVLCAPENVMEKILEMIA